MTKNLAPETVAAQAGGAIDEETGGIVPPLHLATTFMRDPDNQYRKGYSYGRADNATVRQVENVLTQLEGGAASLVLGVGHGRRHDRVPGAGAARARGGAQCHVLGPAQMAAGGCAGPRHRGDLRRCRRSRRHPRRACGPAGPGWCGSRRRPTRCGPSPTSPRRPRIAHAAGAVLAVDSTVPTPVLMQPDRARRRRRHAFGDQVPERPFRRGGRRAGLRAPRTRTSSGPRACAACWARILGPFEAALLLRGMRTLHVRVRHQCAAAHGDRAALRAPSAASRPCSIRGSSRIPATRSPRGRCGAASAACCRCACKGGEAAAIATAANVQAMEAGDLARRRREPDRAPRQHRGAGLALPARSAAAVGRPRERRRPDRRPGAGDARTLSVRGI